MDGARKNSLMAYMRVDAKDLSAADNVLLESIFSASEGYMRGAGIDVPDDPELKDLYDLLVNAMCLDAWERRDMTITGSVVTANPSFRDIKNMLKQLSPSYYTVSDSDTGEAGDPA